jgi:hypothetical protein
LGRAVNKMPLRRGSTVLGFDVAAEILGVAVGGGTLLAAVPPVGVGDSHWRVVSFGNQLRETVGRSRGTVDLATESST